MPKILWKYKGDEWSSMNNKRIGTIVGVIGVIIGIWSLFNSTYTTNIGGDAVTTIFFVIRPNNQSLIMIISLMTIVLGIVILLKGYVSKIRDK